jgi:hypothetical protein
MNLFNQMNCEPELVEGGFRKNYAGFDKVSLTSFILNTFLPVNWKIVHFLCTSAN